MLCLHQVRQQGRPAQLEARLNGHWLVTPEGVDIQPAFSLGLLVKADGEGQRLRSVGLLAQRGLVFTHRMAATICSKSVM